MTVLESELICVDNQKVIDAFVITNAKLKRYNNVMVSISGGSDSDVMLDLIVKFADQCNIHYVFFDTGLEYDATKRHLEYLEEKYDIQIERIRTKKPIPLVCKQYGQPFLSKQVSEWINRLQRHNFKWEDRPFEELIKEYPNCKASLKWWCNMWDKKKDGSESSYNINYNKYLKEFMVLNPPEHEYSNKCCFYAKKEIAKRYIKENNIDLNVIGVRRSEGGARSTAYKNCFTEVEESADEYRPLFWFDNTDKKYYDDKFDIKHSECYTCYGLKRTGCVGCPYGMEFEEELEVVREHEPKMYKAINSIFKESYEYTRKYKAFVEQMKQKKERCV